MTVAWAFPGYTDQVCNSEIPADTPAEQFQDNRDGTVTDTKTGLLWTKCLVGKEGDRCEGKAMTVSWDDAQNLAETSTFAGHNDWRVPDVNELLTIAEDRCVYPSINQDIFPNSPETIIWSAWASKDIEGGAWFVQFSDGTPGVNYHGSEGYVRLVRGGF